MLGRGGTEKRLRVSPAQGTGGGGQWSWEGGLDTPRRELLMNYHDVHGPGNYQPSN